MERLPRMRGVGLFWPSACLPAVSRAPAASASRSIVLALARAVQGASRLTMRRFAPVVPWGGSCLEAEQATDGETNR